MQAGLKKISRWKTFRHRLEVVGVRALGAVVRLLPRRTVHRLGSGLGWLAYWLSSRSRRVAWANLDIAFGDSKTPAEKERIVQQSFVTGVATILGLLWVPRLSRANYQRYVEFTPGSVDRLHALHARGKGVLFVTLHYGDWEMMGVGGAYYDLVMTTVTEQMRNLALRKIVDNLRAHSGNRMIAQKFATAKLFKALKRGEYVAMVIDLNGIPGYGGVWVDFFGLPVFNNATAAILALRTGAAIVGAVSYPQPGGRCLIDCSPELTFTPTGNEDADIRALSQQYSDYCQSVIREHPEFWLWTYRRWKYRPQAEVGRYPFYSQHIPVDRRVSKTINATQSPNVPQQSKP